MKSVLMICYYYPPVNNGGVERSLKFVKYLPGYGWKPVVLTTRQYGRAPAVDEERVVYVEELHSRLYRKLLKKPLGQEISKPQAAVLENVKSPVSRFRRAMVAWIDKWVFFPDNQIRWVLPALWPSLRLLMRGEADVIFTTSPPDSAHLLGLILQKLTGKAWLMDLRDPWTLEPFSMYLQRDGLRRSIEQRLERLCFACADKIVLNTPEAAIRYAELYPASADKMVTIPNGFDAEEMGRARLSGSQQVPWEIEDGDFVISHGGAFSRNPHQDNTPYTLLTALKDFLSHAGAKTRPIRIVFAGDLRPETTAHIAKLDLNGIVDTPGKISHFDAMRLIWRSDLLLVFDPGPQGDTYVRGKIYEYLGAGKPVLGILPAGASRDLLEQYGRVLLADPNDTAGILRALEKAILEEGAPEISLSFDVAIYDRKRQTGKLASYLDEMIHRRRTRTRGTRG